MHRKKYGNIRAIWRRTGGRCHLCHRPVILGTYGKVRIYGADTASVDHLHPQAHGGLHEYDNLRIAHQGCNSRRRTRDAAEARREFSGRSREPFSLSERVAITVLTTAGGASAGAVAGVGVADKKDAVQGASVGAICGGLVGLISGIAGTD